MNTYIKYIFEEEGFDKLDSTERRLNKIDKKFADTDKSLHKLNKTHGKTHTHLDKFNQVGGKQLGVLDSMTSRIPFLGEAVGALVNPYTAATAAIVAIGAALIKAGKEFQKWERQMAKVNVTAQLSRIELSRLSHMIRDIGDDYITSLSDVPDAFNQIISGIGDVPKSLDILDKSLKASQAGFTDVFLTADAAVNVMNSVGDVQARETFDTLFETLKIGKAEFKDIAQYLPKIIPYSNQLGLSFKETSAAFALFTSRGQSAEYTTTLLQNAYKSLADGKKRANIEKLVTVFDDTGKMRRMVDIVSDLDKKFAGLTDKQRIEKLGSLGLDSEAASAFSIFLQNADKFREFNDQVQNSSKGIGALETAFNNSANGLNKWDVIQNKIQSGMIWLGEKVAPIFDKIADKVLGVINFFEELEDKTGIFSASIEYAGHLIDFAMKTAFLAFRPLIKAFNVITGKTDIWGNKLDKATSKGSSLMTGFLNIVKSTFKVLGDVYDILGDIITLDFSKIGDSFGNLRKDIKGFGQGDPKKEHTVKNPDHYNYLLPQNPNKKEDLLAKYLNQVPQTPKSPQTPQNNDAPNNNSDSEMRRIASGGAQTKNIKINIEKGVEIKEIIMQNVQNVAQIRRVFEEMLSTATRDAELSIG